MKLPSAILSSAVCLQPVFAEAGVIPIPSERVRDYVQTANDAGISNLKCSSRNIFGVHYLAVFNGALSGWINTDGKQPVLSLLSLLSGGRWEFQISTDADFKKVTGVKVFHQLQVRVNVGTVLDPNYQVVSVVDVDDTCSR